MILEKQLNEFKPIYTYREGDAIDLDFFANRLIFAAQNYGIPLACKPDQIKLGGLLSSAVTDCIVLYHPDHEKDYYNIAVSIKRQGAIAFVSTNYFGTSKNMKKLVAQQNAKTSVKAGWEARKKGNSDSIFNTGSTDLVNGLIGGAVGALKGLGGSKAKQEEEDSYYSALRVIFDEVIC